MITKLRNLLSCPKNLEQTRQELQKWKSWKPPGHFYSPIPDLNEIREREEQIFNNSIENIHGINLNTEHQLHLLNKLAMFYDKLPFPSDSSSDFRYHYNNEYYSYADGIVLFGMLMHLKPKRLIEIGSGFSSSLTLDTRERFLGKEPQCTFIDPNPERLYSLLSEEDKKNTDIIADKVQAVPKSLFEELEEDDILFIDSSHVSKTGSDLNCIIFEILPLLKKGVYIHLHDIFYPFEYPKEWIYEGVSWNEAYLLKAFLQYNDQFSIQIFTSQLIQNHRRDIERMMPLVLNSEPDTLSLYDDAPGGSIWLKREK